MRSAGNDEITRVVPQSGDCLSSACGGLVQQLLTIVQQLLGALTGSNGLGCRGGIPLGNGLEEGFNPQDPDGDLANVPFPQLQNPSPQYLFSSEPES